MTAFDRIHAHFSILVSNVRKALKESGVPLDHLQHFLQDYCELPPLPPESVTLDEVFDRMAPHFSFLEYHLIEHIIDLYVISMKSEMEEYKKRLEQFEESTPLKHLEQKIQQENKKTSTFQEIKLKLKGCWREVALKKFKLLVSALFYDCHMLHISVVGGCLLMRWQAKKPQVKSVPKQFLDSIGVILLTVGDCVIHKTDADYDDTKTLDMALVDAASLLPDNLKAVELLLAVGGNPHQELVPLGTTVIEQAATSTDANGLTLLDIAGHAHHSHIVTLLKTFFSQSANMATSVLVPDSYGLTALMSAIRQHDNILFLKVIDECDVNAQMENGLTALHLASQFGNLTAVHILLNNGATINASDNEQETPLLVASREGYRDIARVLLEAGANPNTVTPKRYTPLWHVSSLGQYDMVTDLLSAGADPNLTDLTSQATQDKAKSLSGSFRTRVSMVGVVEATRYTPFSISQLQTNAFNSEPALFQSMVPSSNKTRSHRVGMAEVIRYASLPQGPIVMEKRTPLYVACQGGFGNIVSTLLKAKAAPNVRAGTIGWAPLHIASLEGHTDIVQQLLEHSANINITTTVGQTSLALACIGGEGETVSALLDAGADPNMASHSGHTPLIMAVSEKHSHIVDALLSAKANPNIHTVYGQTPLCLAASMGQLDVVMALLDAGAAPNYTAHQQKMTALYAAAESGNSEIVSALLNAGADPNIAQSNSWAPLHIAAAKGHTHIVQQLLQHDANVDLATTTGHTPLIMAVEQKNVSTAQLLLQYGASVTAVTVGGTTAMTAAYSDAEVLEKLHDSLNKNVSLGKYSSSLESLDSCSGYSTDDTSAYDIDTDNTSGYDTDECSTIN